MLAKLNGFNYTLTLEREGEILIGFSAHVQAASVNSEAERIDPPKRKEHINEMSLGPD